MSSDIVNTANPLSRKKDVLPILKIQITSADPQYPVLRELGDTIPTDSTFLVTNPSMSKDDQLISFLGNCLTSGAIGASDGESVCVTSSRDPLKLYRSTGDVDVDVQVTYALGGNILIACISRDRTSLKRSESNLLDTPDDSIPYDMTIFIALAQRAALLDPTLISYPVSDDIPS